MSIETYLLFVSASIVLVLSPGPDLIFMLSRSVAQGRKAGVAAALGINTGAYVHLIAAVTGLSAILATSAIAFTIVKWAGALYLVFLGVQALLGRGSAFEIPANGTAGGNLRTIFWQGFLSDVLNPKVALFFLALLPQFVDEAAGNVPGQILVLGITVNVIAIIINLLLVTASASVSRMLRQNERISTWLQRTMGVVFLGLGVRLATDR